MNTINSNEQTRPALPARSKKVFWGYVLAVSLTMILTFSLTVGAGLFVLRQAGYPAQTEPNQDQLSFNLDADPATEKALLKLETVFNNIKSSYYTELSDAELLQAMTSGLVNELDSPYTMYLTAEQNEQLEESMSGDYSGIGAIVGLNKDGLVEITEVLDKSPAETAGIKVGDLFMAVGETDVTEFRDTSAVAALVRGEEGTSVELTFYRPMTGETVTVEAVRQKISSASVAYRPLTKTVGYIMVREFSHNVSQNFFAAVQELQKAGAKHLVIDLRNNTGGMASEVIAMLDYLLPTATLASLKGREDGQYFESEWRSDAKSFVPDSMRYAIIVNGITASASELFAGCLRDYDKAVLIGEQTFGKGSGTITIKLEDGSAINLTNFLYYLPGGESIEGIGLEPDEIVRLPEEVWGISLSKLTLEQDKQLFAALNALERLE